MIDTNLSAVQFGSHLAVFNALRLAVTTVLKCMQIACELLDSPCQTVQLLSLMILFTSCCQTVYNFFARSLPSSLSLFLLPLKSSCWAVLVKLYISLPAAQLCNRTQTVAPLMTVYYMHSFSPSPHSLSLGRTFSHSCHTQTVSPAIKPTLRHFLD